MMKLRIYPKIFASHFDRHTTASDLKQKLPKKIFDGYFKFGFVRNPWDWHVSTYTYVLKKENLPEHDLVKSMKNFDEFIDWRIKQNLPQQKDFFYEGGQCLMDFIGRMENLENDFKAVCKILNIKAELPHLNASRKDNDYLKYYSRKSFGIVNEEFAEDIKLFGYSIPKF